MRRALLRLVIPALLACTGAVALTLDRARAQEDDRYVAVHESMRAGFSQRVYNFRSSNPVTVYAPVLAPLFGGGDDPGSTRSPMHVGPRRSSGEGYGSKVLCVRSCDGFYFPATGEDRGDRAEMCRSACPDAETTVFQGSSIEGATDNAGRRYEDLATAYLYRTRRVDQCTCHRAPESAVLAEDPLKDPTLRKGDIVTTATGAVVFKGNRAGPPWRAEDFQAYASSPLLTKTERTRLAGLLGQSRETLQAKAGKPVGKPQPEDAGDEDLTTATISTRSSAVASQVAERPGPRVVWPSPLSPPSR
jgi:hypothetical protein